MRSIAYGVVALATLTGCPSDSISTSSPPDSSAKPSATTSAGATTRPLRSGDPIVVAHQATSFREGIVLAVEGGSLRYRYGQPAQNPKGARVGEVMRSRAWRLGNTTPTAIDVHAICQVDAKSWLACRTKSVSGELITAIDPLGKSHNLDRSRLVIPGAATQADIAALFAKQDKARQFDAALLKALAQAAKDSPCPKPGAIVAARYGDFHRARVKKVQPGCATLAVEWLDRPPATRTVKRFDLVSLSSALPKTKAGEFVLDRAAENKPWRAFRVTEVGSGYLGLENRVGGSSKSTGKLSVRIGP